MLGYDRKLRWQLSYVVGADTQVETHVTAEGPWATAIPLYLFPLSAEKGFLQHGGFLKYIYLPECRVSRDG